MGWTTRFSQQTIRDWTRATGLILLRWNLHWISQPFWVGYALTWDSGYRPGLETLQTTCLRPTEEVWSTAIKFCLKLGLAFLVLQKPLIKGADSLVWPDLLEFIRVLLAFRRRLCWESTQAPKVMSRCGRTDAVNFQAGSSNSSINNWKAYACKWNKCRYVSQYKTSTAARLLVKKVRPTSLDFKCILWHFVHTIYFARWQNKKGSFKWVQMYLGKCKKLKICGVAVCL